jgi:uncharacterized protein with HEPN domain
MSRHDPRLTLSQMLALAREARDLCRGRVRADLDRERLLELALLRLLGVIGEASTRLPDEIVERHPEVPWASIVGLRNRLIHGYDRINLDKDLQYPVTVVEFHVADQLLKKLSGLGSLEEINRVGGEDLPRFKRLSTGGEVRPDESGAEGGRLGSGEHRGGSSTDGDGRVPPVSERSERLAGGGGDAADVGRSPAAPLGDSDAATAGRSRGDQSNGRRAQTIAAIEALKPSDFPLSLTTNHYEQITVRGVDVFKPQTGEVISDGPEGIACWFIDTDYNEESFFVRHAYFLGANDPYSALKNTLKAEINAEAWATLNSDTSRAFEKPKSGRIAVKVINHLGDEVMKVFRV